MDENVKNDAKQVMLVQNADDGRLQAVTGVDRDGNIQTADPTDQNVASLLNVNTQDSALEAFFKKFMEQAQNPVHTGIFVMTENALNKLIRIDFDPEILENYRIDPSERLQTQEQRQFERKYADNCNSSGRFTGWRNGHSDFDGKGWTVCFQW